MHRFFILSASIIEGKFSAEEKDFCHQISRVLRLNYADKIIILDNTNKEFVVKLTNVSSKKVEGEIIEQRKNLAEPEIKLTLFQAVLKNPVRFELVLQKGTELGVSCFVPLITERSEARNLRNIERLNRIIQEATEQSERGTLPQLEKSIEFKKIFTNNSTTLKNPTINLLGDSFSLDNPMLNQFLSTIQKTKTVNIFIGPEGGFSEQEINLARENNFQTFSLGPRILRSETAGIATAALILLS